MRISKNNIIFISLMIIIYILLDFLMKFRGTELIQLIVFQLVLIVIAISPVGEAVLRFIYGMKVIKTNKDKEYLMQLFEEVYETVRENENYNNDRIRIYIDESMAVNAYALGTRTIGITRGVIETLTDNQIKGFFAHEFGHIINR